MSTHEIRLAIALVCAALCACGPAGRPVTGGDDDVGDPCSPSDGPRCKGPIWQVCENGHYADETTCPLFCSDTIGCIACDPAAGQVCDGGDVHVCNPDGTVGPPVTQCNGIGCANGQCLTECALAASVRSYIGCEYWPVDLDNAVDIIGPPQGTPPSCAMYLNNPKMLTIKTCDDGQSPFYLSTCDWNDECPAGTTCKPHDVCALNGQGSPFAIVVSNPSTTKPANVTLANATGFTRSVAVAPQTVATLVPQDLGFADQSLDYSGIETKSYHLTSDMPIIAYQFNPLNNVGVFTNDGSLLIPATAFDTDYYAITTKSLSRRPLRQDWNGYITVVTDDVPQTTVTITPTADTRPGTAVPALAANSSMTFTLAPFQTLTVEAVASGDLTGSRVQCQPRCGVFAGHEATNLGTNAGSNICCADHLEDTLFPASTWGKRYVVSRSAARMTGVPDLVRVVAQKPNTTLSITPQVTGCSQPLGPGQFCEFLVDADTDIIASEPILVGHLLLSNGGLDHDSGDPGLSFGIAVEQYRKDYTLLVPAQYDANYFAIAAPVGGSVMLDGIDVTSQLQSAGTGQYRVGRFPVAAGQHQLVCPQTCGVEAEGWSEAVSYLYAGGLNLEQIVIN